MALRSRKCVGTVAPLLGLPSLLSEFLWSYSQLIDFNAQWVCGPDQYINYDRPNHSFHSFARNDIAKAARGEWTLQLDTDHSFSPDLLLRLLNVMRKYDADVVSGLYFQKSPPHLPNLWRWKEDGETAQQIAGWDKGEVLEIGVAGGGCLLVKNRVFDRIYNELGEEPFSTQEFPGKVGEDFAFFRRLKKLGIKAICDTKVECYHLQIRPIRQEFEYDESKVTTRQVPVRRVG